MLINVVLDAGAELPRRAHDDDAGADLYSQETCTIPPLSNKIFDTGVHVAIPRGYCGQIWARSGLNMRDSCVCTGLIDSGYQGSIAVNLYNQGSRPVLIKRGDRIAQLVVVPFERTTFLEVDEFDEITDRGSSGFGSTGR